MTKNKTIIVFCLVFIFGFMVGKNLDRTIESYKSMKRWGQILDQLNNLNSTPYDSIKQDLEKIQSGVTLDGHRLYVDEISYIENEAKNEIGIKLRTPNVKVVRAIFENFKYTVIKVDRVAFAGLTKKNLPRGNWRALTEQEIINIKNM